MRPLRASRAAGKRRVLQTRRAQVEPLAELRSAKRRGKREPYVGQQHCREQTPKRDSHALVSFESHLDRQVEARKNVPVPVPVPERKARDPAPSARARSSCWEATQINPIGGEESERRR